ncbi:hypothetical protein DFH07DRAFT_972489 [Mycena maculata]|uniref:Uncharacterized protein n=1 Tax=Mycena maculata TaxID=230809 RepID=A0AAD7HH96_9AGAR|nr:hypothetical protein DFH07DRAFT_972489 [Mycena maculata]
MSKTGAVLTHEEQLLQEIVDLLEKQQKKEYVKDRVQIHSGLSVVAVFIASLSLSLLSYAASLAQSNALNNNALLRLNYIWFITTGFSLLIAGCTGIVAVTAGISQHTKKSWGVIVIIGGLFIILFAMMVGLILLANSLAVNTPLGNVHLPGVVIYPIVAVALVIMVLLAAFMMWSEK